MTQFNAEPEVLQEETLPEIDGRIKRTFITLGKVAKGVVGGHIRAAVVSGAAGVGKTYTLERELNIAEAQGMIKYDVVKGAMSAIGLYRKLWESSGNWRDLKLDQPEGEDPIEDSEAVSRNGVLNVLLLDDCDSIFADLDALNLLKAALDTTRTRKVHWNKESRVLDEEGIPRNFEFNGAVVFITNIDFQREVDADKKMSPHYAALMSRSFYVDLGIHTRREIFVRIGQVVFSKEFLKGNELSKAQAEEMMAYLVTNLKHVRTLSIRTILQLASLIKTDPDWKDMADGIILKKHRR